MGTECSCIKGNSDQAVSYDIVHGEQSAKPMRSHHAPDASELLATPEKAISLAVADPSPRRSWIRTALAKLPLGTGAKEDESLKQEDLVDHKAASVSPNEVANEEQSSEPASDSFAVQAAGDRKHKEKPSTAGGPPELCVLSPEEVAQYVSHPTITELRQRLGKLYLDPLDPSATVYRLGPVKRKSRIYVAEWTSEGVMYGRGCIFAPNEYCYEGYIVEGRKEVFGRLIFADGSYYMGCFSNDEPEGEGKYWQESGAMVEGVFRKGRFCQGVETRADGLQYKGEFAKWKWHGQGTLVRPDGSRYTGEFANGMFNGKGTLDMPAGTRYEGEWLNDKMHGTGRFTWKDGSVYEGSYVNDQKHGYGELTTPDGRSYQGGWKKGKRHGNGQEIRVDHHGKRHQRQRTWTNGVVKA